eukprot:1145349-Pelagomonas_calceolata.AAC.8
MQTSAHEQSDEELIDFLHQEIGLTLDNTGNVVPEEDYSTADMQDQTPEVMSIHAQKTRFFTSTREGAWVSADVSQ